MPMRVLCPECGRQLLVGDDRIGKNSTCPNCRTTFPVQAENESAEETEDFAEEDEDESGGG
ncbi:MAG: hypothetical protein IAG10_06920, partial [Planctomycetaceae bacterium]|nr:hypothetical protein [Planctomycetaceae bacterium]